MLAAPHVLLTMRVLFIKAMFAMKAKSFWRFQTGTAAPRLLITKIHANNTMKMKD